MDPYPVRGMTRRPYPFIFVFILIAALVTPAEAEVWLGLQAGGQNAGIFNNLLLIGSPSS